MLDYDTWSGILRYNHGFEEKVKRRNPSENLQAAVEDEYRTKPRSTGHERYRGIQVHSEHTQTRQVHSLNRHATHSRRG